MCSIDSQRSVLATVVEFGDARRGLAESEGNEGP